MLIARTSHLWFAGLLAFLGSPGNAQSLIPSAPVSAVHAAHEAAVETTGVWRGRIESLVVDNREMGTSRTRQFLRSSEATYELLDSGRRALRAGSIVELTGRVAGARITTEQVISRTAASDAGSCTALGEQRLAVILASFPSKPLLSSVTPALLRSSLFGEGRTLDGFLRESSFGQSWLSGDVFGPFILDGDYFDQPLAVRDAAVRAVAPSATLAGYNRIVVVAPQGETGMESGGMALLGCGPIPSPQGELYASSIWLGAESLVSQNQVVEIAAHELGHGFGLEHARFADYGSESLGPAGQAPAPWDALHEYGDSYSNMGRNSAQWAAPQKAEIGWLRIETGFQSVTAGGDFRVSPYELQGGVQALRIRRDPAGEDWLWLEYRQNRGAFDATLPLAAFDGALAHYADPALAPTVADVDAAAYSNLVSFHPQPGSAAGPVLRSGETWADPYGSLRLSVTAATPARLDVTVAYAPAPACPASLGTVPALTSGSDGSQITVQASNGCVWTADASVAWIQLGSLVSGSGNGAVSFTVTANPSVSPRWGKISVGGAFAVITQAGASSGMTLSPLSAAFTSAGGNGGIAVSTSAPDLAWTTGVDADWITDIECSCGLEVGPASIRYIVAANAGAARSASISIGGLAFKVTQDAGAPDRTPAWNLLAPRDAPSARLNQAFAPFSSLGRAILYGGQWDLDFSAETWLWSGSEWTLLQPVDNPGLLAGHAMAYDAKHGQIVLFGGQSGTSYEMADRTWVFDGANWEQLHPAAIPPARIGHAMAYDAVNGNVVLFGGSGMQGELDDTWIWDGVNWAQASSHTSPLPRSGHGMTFDAGQGQVVLFGGMKGSGVPTWFSDTWVWEGQNWQPKSVATPPAARTDMVLAYHPALRAVVMIGGTGGKSVTASGWNYDFRKETWLWDGERWTQQFPEGQPGPAYTLGAAYDESLQALTVHLGDDLTCVSRGPKTLHLTGAAKVRARIPVEPPRNGKPPQRTP